MKYLIAIILFFLALTVWGQGKVMPTYLRVGSGDETISCQETIMKIYIDKHRMIFETPQISLDLKIVVRAREYWLGIDSLKNEYRIETIQIGDKYGMAVLSDTAIGFYIHPSKELCD